MRSSSLLLLLFVVVVSVVSVVVQMIKLLLLLVVVVAIVDVDCCLSRLYPLALLPFYEKPVLANMADVVKERIKEGVRIHRKQLVDYDSVKQRNMMWHKLTSASYLPLFPCKHILPTLCTYWNSIKYVGDQIMQML